MTWSGRVVTEARAYWLPHLPLRCRKCGSVVRADLPWTVGHIVPRSLGGSVTDRANQWPEHPHCNYREGGQLGAAKTNGRRRARVAASVVVSERSRGIRGI